MTNEILNMNADFDNLMRKANAIQEKCRDEVFVAADLRMADDLTINNMSLSPLAQGHLCGKLQIPSRYFSRLVEAHENKLAAANVNCWLEDDGRKLMLREYDGHIRGVLSGSYSKYDAPEILSTIYETFGEDHFKIRGAFINEERLHVRFVEKEMLPVEGEDLFAGITLDSSDVGRAGLSVKFLIWKQVCTNGLTVPKSMAKIFSQKHIGISHDSFAENLKNGLENFNAIKLEIADRIVETSKIPTGDDIAAVAEDIKARTKLSDDDVEEMFELINVNYSNTRWGLINGITEIAQKFSLERRLELEEIAGSMLV